MASENTQNGLTSRYILKKMLGEYPPWRGYGVADSLSDKQYLIFSLSEPANVAFSLDDLRMRDFLFSRGGGIVAPALSIQRVNGSITVLLPHADLVPLTKALPSMKSERAEESLRFILRELLARLADGLSFNNLNLESFAAVGDRLTLLPTAYLLPADLIAALGVPVPPDEIGLEAICRDLRRIAEVVRTASRYMDGGASARAAALAQQTAALGPTTGSRDWAAAVSGLAEFAGSSEAAAMLAARREFPFRPPAAAVKTVRQAAIKAREGEKQCVLVRGAPGEGTSRFLRETTVMLAGELGLANGIVERGERLFHDPEEEDVEPLDYFIIDDEPQDTLLACHIMERLLHAVDGCALVIAAVSDETPPYYLRELTDELGRRNVSVREVAIPPLGAAEKRRLVADAAPARAADLANLAEGGAPLARLRIAALQSVLAPEAGLPLEALGDEERSMLTFLAVFRFGVPLAVLRNIYPADETAVYGMLHGLVSRGLVAARAEASSLSGGEFALVYGIPSTSIGREIIEDIPAPRRKQIHRNIALLLEGIRGAPLHYGFYHLSRGGEKAKAAERGYEIFNRLIRRKKLPAINCFNESYLDEKLDRHLPPETRFTLLLELGDYFTLTGGMDRAEHFYRRCREEIAGCEATPRFRTLAVESVRRECEILEKKGEFQKAEKLLERALDAHGAHIIAGERAKLYNDLAWNQYRLGQFDRSWENCLLVHKLLDEKQNPAEIAQAYNLMGTINWNRSKYDDAILCHKRCLAIREECGDEIGIAASCNNLGLAYRSMGLMADALECFKKSMEIKNRLDNLPGIAAAHLNIALAYLDTERLKEAERSCTSAIRLAESIGNQQLLAESCGTLGEIYFLQGNHEKAAQCYFKDLHLCHKTKSLRERAVVFRRLGELSLAKGKLTETLELLSQARALNEQIGSRLETALCSLLEGRIMLAEGRQEEGRRALEGASLELSLLGKKNAAAGITAELGKLYLEDGNEPLAREYLLRASALAGESEGLPQQVRELQETLDRRSPLTLAQISNDSDRFRALCKIASIVRTVHNPDELHAAVTETVRRMMGMERAALILRADGKDSFRIVAASGDFTPGSTVTDRNIAALLAVTLQLGYPLDIARTSIPEGKVAPDFLAERPRIICIPLRIQEEVSGLLYLDSTQGGVGASDEDHSFLIAFSQQVALALEKILLLEKVNRQERPLPGVKPIAPRQRERITFQDLVGTSAAMRRIYELVEGIRDMETTVLLTGSNGTGKDLIAKTIHDSGRRAEKPFVALNCAAIPEELLESELFGHERGSFTGAHRQHIGHFESANGGTIFLNEIGDMPLMLQPKLLHVLEEQNFYRIGGTTRISTDVRIIAATNKDLKALVSQGRFREDLYYRLNIFPIRIPDLKERIDDIPLLASHFLAQYCRLYGIPVKTISAEAMAHLRGYEWPGNVRELENLVNRLIIISKKDIILPEDLPDYIIRRPERARAEAQATVEEVIESMLDRMEYSKSDPILPKVEGMLVHKLVEKTGDKTKAAAMLGVSKPTIYKWLKKYEGK